MTSTTQNSKHILITGTAGFIGFHLAERLLRRGDTVVGLDNINDYYDVRLKYGRLRESGIEEKEIEYNKPLRSIKYPGYRFIKLNLEDRENILKLFKNEKFDVVVNIAAQAGVRYSLVNPYAYINSNITGFLNILEGCRHEQVKHLVFASSSSVYGANTKMPFSVHHNVDHPVSLYAATKKANELTAHTYSSLYKIPCTGLRFFTVYGPWGRPDMALFLFTKAILKGKPIDVFNYGKMQRDFTYIDDIIEGVVRVIDRIPEPDIKWSSDAPNPSSSYAPYRLYNIGNNNPVELMRFIEVLEDCLGKKAEKNLLPMQAGDVPATYADVDDLMRDVGFKPKTPIEDGIRKFVEWYKNRDRQAVPIYWYAVHVRSRHEFKVLERLTESGIEAFLPVVERLSRWKDRKKLINFPLFSGYLFVHIHSNNTLPVLKTNGVVRLLGAIPGEPQPVPEEQIISLKRLIESKGEIDPYPYLKEGERVRIKSGPLAGIEGILTERRGQHMLVVSVDVLRQGAALKIAASDVEKI